MWKMCFIDKTFASTLSPIQVMYIAINYLVSQVLKRYRVLMSSVGVKEGVEYICLSHF